MVIVAVAACGPAATSTPSAPTGVINVTLLAGPTCPVERIPPDPNCAPRAVANEVVTILRDGQEVARGRTDATGKVAFRLPPGTYGVKGLSEAGFFAPPEASLVDLGRVPIDIQIDYDTGIR